MRSDEQDDELQGHDGENETFRTSEADQRNAAELVALLEDDLGVDTRRVHLWYRAGTVYLQGTVDTHELRQEIEKMLATRSIVREIESSLTVHTPED